MLSDKLYKVSLLATLFIFTSSTFIPALTYAQPLAVSDKDWQYVNGNSWAQNNNPQTQINSGNVDQLEVKWMFPITPSSISPSFIQDLNPGEGSTTPPIVVDGKVYILTVFLSLIAIDAKTGRTVWTYQYEVNLDEAQERLPLIPRGGHIHGFRYWESENVLIIPGLACDFKAIDATTGEEKFTIGPICADVPGSLYPFYSTTNAVNNIGTYEKGRLFIGGVAFRDLGHLKSGRSAILGIDMDDPSQIVWRVFTMPPQDRPVNDWALQECDKGWFFTIPCSQVRSEAPDVLQNDWQMNPGETPFWSVATTAAWGQPVVDEDTGYVYLNTGNATPFWYIELRPGPNLYSATILAIDSNTGQLAWWVQDVPRDPWDYDCNWSGFLADDTELGKVYVKGCKLGFLHVRDALTGEPIHYIDVRNPNEVDSRMTPKPLRTDQLGVKEPLNPLDTFLMKEWVMTEEYPVPPAFEINPTFLHGSFGSETAYNDGTIFHYVQSAPRRFENPWGKLEEGVVYTLGRETAESSATLVARDLVTGEVKWMYFYPYGAIRAFPIVTGNTVILPQPDGYMRFLNEDTGELLREMNLGAPMIIGSTVGKDSDGNSKIFTIVGAVSGRGIAQGGFVRSQVSGTLVALGLSERPTIVTTTVTTATTVTAPAQTVTATEEVEVGLPAAVTYAAVAIAVIAIIAAAVLATRKR